MRWSFVFLATVLAGAGRDGGSPVAVRWLDATDVGTMPGAAGSADLEEIRSVVRSHHPDLKRCYDASLGQARRPAGTTSLRWAIGEDGEVRAVEILSSTHGFPALDTCIVESVRSWRFPRPRGSRVVVVTYPFLFKEGTLPRDGDGSQAAHPGAQDARSFAEARLLESQDAGTTFGMDPEEIRAVVRSHHAELQRCYDQAAVQTPRITGKTTIRWVIGETGEVRAVERIHSTHGAPGLDGCIVEAIGSWRFPAPRSGGRAIVTYPFAFRAVTPDAGLPGPRDGGR